MDTEADPAKTRTVIKSADNGEFVSAETAKRRPRSTYRQTVKASTPPTRGKGKTKPKPKKGKGKAKGKTK